MLELDLGYSEVALELLHASDPEPWVMTYGVASGDPIPQDLANYAAGLVLAWEDTGNSLLDILSNQVTFTKLKLKIGTGIGQSPILYEYVVGDVGTVTSEMLPQNCALHVKKTTARGGRRNQGRFFVPGVLIETSVSSVGRINTALINTLQGVFNNVLTEHADPAGANSPMVILHSDSGTPPVFPTEVTNLVVDPVISTQRRRLR